MNNQQELKHQEIVIKTILEHVWTLKKEQVCICETFVLKKSTVSKFLQLLNTDHDYLDRITIQGSGTYRVYYVNGSTSYLEQLLEEGKGQLPLLISLRGSKVYKTYSCLVMINPSNKDKFNDPRLQRL